MLLLKTTSQDIGRGNMSDSDVLTSNSEAMFTDEVKAGLNKP